MKNPVLVSLFGVGFLLMGMNIALFSYVTFVLLGDPFNINQSIVSWIRSEEHTSELQSRFDLVCRLLLEKKKKKLYLIRVILKKINRCNISKDFTKLINQK